MPTAPAIYVRVSTVEQSVDSQVRDLREFCSARGLNDVTEYCDAGVSGMKDSRPAWNRCWDAVQKGRHNMLMVHALDRVGRSLPHLVMIMEYLRCHHIALVSYRENIDLSTSAGKMLAGMFALMAEYERNIISERTKAGLRQAKAAGKQMGRPRALFDEALARKLLVDQGFGQNKTARIMRASMTRVHAYRRRLESEGILPPTGYSVKGIKIVVEKPAILATRRKPT